MGQQRKERAVYLQLADQLREQMKTGELQPGEMLPSESKMMQQYGVARLTVRAALDVLVAEGLVEKRQGKGSFCRFPSGKKRIHVLLNVTDYYFVPYYIQGIGKALRRNGAEFVALDTYDSNDEISSCLEKMEQNESDGVIVQISPKDGFDRERLTAALEGLSARGIPYIMIDTVYDFLPGSYVTVGEMQAGALAAQCFLKHGHTKTAGVGVAQDDTSRQRMEGFSAAMPVQGIYHVKDGWEEALLGAIRSGVTGLFCFNDYVAKQTLDLVTAAGISVPEEISIISVDDTVISEIYHLTSVSHPKSVIGEAAAEALLSGSLPFYKEYVPCLVERNSVKQLAGER